MDGGVECLQSVAILMKHLAKPIKYNLSTQCYTMQAQDKGADFQRCLTLPS